MSVLTPMLLAGCSKPVLDYRNAEISNGKIYERGANQPFTGTITNLSGNTLLAQSRQVLAPSKLAGIVLANESAPTPELNDNDRSALRSEGAMLLLLGPQCDVQLEDGVFVGAGVILTHCVGVKVTHLGNDGGFGRRNVDSGASSGDQGIGASRGEHPGDRQADGVFA